MRNLSWAFGVSAALWLMSGVPGAAYAQTLDAADVMAGAGTLGGTGGMTGSTAGEIRYDGGVSSPDAFAFDTSPSPPPGSVASGRLAPDMAAISQSSAGQGAQPAGPAGPGAAAAPVGPTPWAQPPR